MKKLFTLLLLAAIVMFPACNSSTSDDDKDDNGSGTTGAASTYLPFKTGNSWTFTSTDEFNSSTYTNAISGSATIDGKTYWIMEEAYDIAYADTTYFRVADNNLYTFFDDSMFSGEEGFWKRAKIVGAFKAAVADIGPEVIIAKFGVKAGTTWTIYDITLATGEKASVKGKYVGLENVQTTAGTFANCAKFGMDISYSGNVEGMSMSWTATTFYWFASGVGQVKMSTTTEYNYSGQKQTFTSTDILKSYVVK